MDLLDRLLGHDEWTNGELLRRCGELTESQLRHRFDIGHGTVHDTLVHMIGSVGVWISLMRTGRAPEGTDGWDGMGIGWAEKGIPSIATEHERSYAEFVALAREIRDAERWDEHFIDTLDDPPQAKSFGGAILHVVTHNMHHRGELLHMLSRLGVKELPEGDLLSWEARATAEKGVITS